MTSKFLGSFKHITRLRCQLSHDQAIVIANNLEYQILLSPLLVEIKLMERDCIRNIEPKLVLEYVVRLPEI